MNKTTNRGQFGQPNVIFRRHNTNTSGEQSTAILGGTTEPVTVRRSAKATSCGLFYIYNFISSRNCVLMNERVVVRLVSLCVPLSTTVVAEVSGARPFDNDSRSFSCGLKVHSA